jgi:TonB family protein
VIDPRLLACAVGSVVAHVAFGELLALLPEREPLTPARRVEVQVVPRESPPPPPSPPEPTPEPVTRPIERVAVKPTSTRRVNRSDPPPKPTATPPTTAETPGTGQPVFGVSMESTSETGKGPPVQIGNTGSLDAPVKTPSIKPGTRDPVPAAAVTKMPLPKGRCAGTYTDAAREAAIEGVVVLDLVVDERGVTRDIAVVAGLSHGLTEAAIAALRACSFSPGERDGAPVTVRVRGFKIRFVLDRP